MCGCTRRMAQVQLMRKLLQDDRKAASQLLLTSLKTPTQFAQFLDAERQKDLHAAFGEALTLILALANQNPAYFMYIFELLQAQYEKFILIKQEPIVYRVCIALFVFLSYFLRKEYKDALSQAELKFGRENPQAFAEFVMLDCLQKGKLETAWHYEHSANLLALLAERASDYIEMVAALLCLHEMHGETCDQQLEALELKYGKKKLANEIQRMREYVNCDKNKEATQENK